MRICHAVVVACVAGWLLLTPAVHGQTFIFASPNTREHMSDEFAAQSLDSLEQRNFLAVAGHLAGRLCEHPVVQGGLGVFEENTENTAMVSGCAADRARYLGELLARYAHQEWLLIFSADPKGSERLVVLSFFSGQPLKIPGEMRKFGLSAGTILVEPGNRVKIYLWAASHVQDAAVRALAGAHQAQAEEIAGKGALIGSNSRAEAQHVFDREIAAYERRRRRKLSALLWTRKLHDLGLGGPNHREQ